MLKKLILLVSVVNFWFNTREQTRKRKGVGNQIRSAHPDKVYHNYKRTLLVHKLNSSPMSGITIRDLLHTYREKIVKIAALPNSH